MATIPRSLVLTLSLASLAFSSSGSSSPTWGGASPKQNSAAPDLTVHEWGTFTSVAGRSGQAVKWHPRSGFRDLPSFIEHFRTAWFKGSLQGTVRMETPVLYFYSPTETTVSVKVRFSNGVITEWYPHASQIKPDPKEILDDSILFHSSPDGSIAWDSVTVEPGLDTNFLRDDSEANYSAARETSATPLLVNTSSGVQQEKFLFYRGVAAFPVPISAQPLPDGRVRIRNLEEEEIPGVILFERRGDNLGYRLLSDAQGTALRAQNEYLLDRPELDASLESVSHDLEQLLIAEGLYPDEAHAILETWRSSWLEEGSRLIYIVPTHFVNSVLRLSIKPEPAKIVRAFVGRLELITPATEQAVEDALAAHDRYTITFTYGRFLEPILEQMKAEDPERAPLLDEELSETYNTQPVRLPRK